MKTLRIKILLACLLVVAAIVSLQVGTAQKLVQFIKTDVISSVIFDLTNENRAEHLRPSLKTNDLLTAAAQMKADDMASKGYFSHTTQDGQPFTYWLNKAGYDYIYAGENLAVKFTDSEKIVKAWMESRSHRLNLLSTKYQEIGIGIATGEYKGKEAIFVVQVFGSSFPWFE